MCRHCDWSSLSSAEACEVYAWTSLCCVAEPQKGIVVQNYATRGAVNGEAVDPAAAPAPASGNPLASLASSVPAVVAFPAPFNATTDVAETAASKLKVGPGVLELPYRLGSRLGFSDLWFVATGAPPAAQQPLAAPSPSPPLPQQSLPSPHHRCRSDSTCHVACAPPCTCRPVLRPGSGL